MDRLKIPTSLNNNLMILSHVFQAVPGYTAGIMAYNAIRALVVVGDLWVCRAVISWLTRSQPGENGFLFAGVAMFYGLYILLDYLGNQLSIFLMNWYGSIRSVDLSKYMRELLYHKLEEVELSCYEENEFYDDLGRVLNEIDTRPIQVVNSFATGVYYLLTLVLITAIIFDPVFIVAALLYVVKYFFHLAKVNRINFEMDRDTQSAMRKAQYIRELFKNREFIKETRNYQAEDFFIRFGECAAMEDLTISTAYNKKGSKAALIIILFGYLLNLLIVVYLCGQMLAGRYMPGDFVYLISSFSAFTNNLSGLIQIASEMRSHSMYIKTIRKILEYTSPRKRQPDPCSAADPGSFERVCLENVSFRYGEGAIVLRNMDLCIRKGEKAALVGRNGSGKSTLVKLLLDLYPVQEGSILYNGMPYDGFGAGQLISRFSAVFQDAPIYALSVAENVLMRESVSEADEKLVAEALAFSGLWEKVSSLEKGMHTMLTKEFDTLYFSARLHKRGDCPAQSPRSWFLLLDAGFCKQLFEFRDLRSIVCQFCIFICQFCSIICQFCIFIRQFCSTVCQFCILLCQAYLKFHNLRRQQFLQFLTHLITLLYHSLKQFYICLRCHVDNGIRIPPVLVAAKSRAVVEKLPCILPAQRPCQGGDPHVGFPGKFLRHKNLHRKDHAVDAVDPRFLFGHGVLFAELSQQFYRLFLPDDRNRGVRIKDISSACLRFVQARVGQCLVKSPGVHVIARRFVLKDIIPEKEIGNIIFDHDVMSLFDDEQVYFQGHSAQIMLPLIGQVLFIIPQFQFHGGAECGMPLYIVLYFQ